MEDDPGTDPFAAQEPLFAQTVAASLQGRVALGSRAGQPVRRLRSAAAAVTAAGPRCARFEGFSLHADVAVPARRRDRLEHLVRYLVRPPLALTRLTESSGGQLLYQFRRPWRDGSTALLLDPLELRERLAALVPPPRRPLLAYHGVLAPRARWRAAIVARPTPDDTRADAGARSPGWWTWARLLRRVFTHLIDYTRYQQCGGTGADHAPVSSAVRPRVRARGTSTSLELRSRLFPR